MESIFKHFNNYHIDIQYRRLFPYICYFQSALNREELSIGGKQNAPQLFGAVITTITSEEQSKMAMIKTSESIISHFQMINCQLGF